jgi:hypothetical protein
MFVQLLGFEVMSQYFWEISEHIPINTMVRFLKLVAFLDHFRAIFGKLLKKRSQNGPKTLLILKIGPWC